MANNSSGVNTTKGGILPEKSKGILKDLYKRAQKEVIDFSAKNEPKNLGDLQKYSDLVQDKQADTNAEVIVSFLEGVLLTAIQVAAGSKPLTLTMTSASSSSTDLAALEARVTVNTNDITNLRTDLTALEDVVNNIVIPSETPLSILNKLKTVDGHGSGLDADMLDGKHATDFSLAGHTHTFASITDKPTTLAGYGITDAASSADVAAIENANFIAGTGLTGGGNLPSDITFNVGAADGTIVVNADSIQVGVVETANINNGAVTPSKLSIAYTPASRLINTTAPITGGGALTGDLTIGIADGPGSGLNADLLDGQHGSFYATSSSLSTLNTQVQNDVSFLDGSKDFTGTVGGLDAVAPTDFVTKQQMSGSIHAFANTYSWQQTAISGQDTPPISPSIGDRYLLNSTDIETGVWIGHGDEIAEWDGTQWVFTLPYDGMVIKSPSGIGPGQTYAYSDGQWWNIEEGFFHSRLQGLLSDDHPQYLNNSRGDARYPQQTITIGTNAPLTGGGDLSANRILDITDATPTARGTMTAADKGKLNGIQAGAQVNPSAATILSQLLTVDGTGSGLDADLLDGQHGAYYAPNADLTAHIGSGGTAHALVTPSVDGFMSAADKAKLDTLGPVSPSDLLTAIKTVDGAGSGLDADLLDGQHGSFYQNASNLNAGTIGDSRLPERLQSQAIPIADCDLAIENGWFHVPTSTPNSPSVGITWLLSVSADHSSIQQIALAVAGGGTPGQTTFRRSFVGGAWTSWVLQYTTLTEQAALWAPLSHVGSGGSSHAAVTTSTNGFMLAADKVKLNGIPILDSDVYSPTTVLGTNVTTASVLSATYQRIGNIVSVSMRVITGISSAPLTSNFEVTLPIASNFTSINNCTGVVSSPQAGSSITGEVTASASNNRAIVTFQTDGTGTSMNLGITFQYRIL